MPSFSGRADDALFAIDIPYKCPYEWRKMKGDERVRFCGSCKKNVYNISNMTRKEAVSLISEKEDDLCVRFYKRWDGKIVTQECVSIIGSSSLRETYNILAAVNACFATIALILLPLFGPALVTIQQGGMVPMASDASDANSTDKPDAAVNSPVQAEPDQCQADLANKEFSAWVSSKQASLYKFFRRE